MAKANTAAQLQSLFIEYFQISPEQFDWEQPLEQLHQDFKILSYLVYLEQLIQQHLGVKIPMIENISTGFHTPKDILALINRML